MDISLNSPFDVVEEWDGWVGWFAHGIVLDGVDAVSAVFENDYSQPHRMSGVPNTTPLQYSPPTASSMYTFGSVPEQYDLQWTAASTKLPYTPATAYVYSQYEGYANGTSPVETPHNADLDFFHQQTERFQQQPELLPPLCQACVDSPGSDLPVHGHTRRTRSLHHTPSSDPQSLSKTDPPLRDHQQVDKPRRQGPRFTGDEYAAAWIRGDGTEREGWCGLCSTWHKLKDSAYWYHMHYSHGISCQTGKPFRQPLKMRPVKKSLGYEVLCGVCNQWLQVSRAERWRTPYFRHAYRCHAKLHPKGEKSRAHSSSPKRSTSKK